MNPTCYRNVRVNKKILLIMYKVIDIHEQIKQKNSNSRG